MIDVKNLTKIFPHSNTPAVDNISFNLDVGQIGCLIGTSGCGKTTTLKMLNKLIEPSSGTIKINNQGYGYKVGDIILLSNTNAISRNINYVFLLFVVHRFF